MTQPDDPFRTLVHKVNNLLAVIATQAAVARGEDSKDAFARALAVIERSAEETGRLVRELRGRG
ncbi:MAG: hypothetical protein IT458_11245 [Planctomycetes bacterium]|nr:hypothetical protein [Planctomycetota bacterium]